MFETNNLKNKVDSLENKLEDLNSDRRLLDIDLEKRIIVLEKEIKDIHNTVSVIEGLGESDFAKEFSEVKDAIRRIEDLVLVDKLEILNNKDSSEGVKGEIGELNHKIALTTDAIKIISEKVALKNGNDGKGADNSEIENMKSQLSAISERIEKLSDSGRSGIGRKDFRLLFRETENIEDAFSKLVSTVNDKMKSYGLRIESFDKMVRQSNEDVAKKFHKFENGLNSLEEYSKKIDKLESVQGDLSTYYKKIDEIKNNLEIKLPVQR